MKGNWTLLTGWLFALLPGIAGAADPFVAPKDSAPKKGDPAGYVDRVPGRGVRVVSSGWFGVVLS